MTYVDAQKLQVEADAFGYASIVRELRFNAGFRLYLYKPGFWTFCDSGQDLQEVHDDAVLWVKDIYHE